MSWSRAAWGFFVISLAAVAAGYFLWPPFDRDFWIELAILIGALLLSLGSAAVAAFKSPRTLRRWLGVIPALLGVSLLVVVVMCAALLHQAGASIESFRTRAERGASRAQSNHLVYVRLASRAPHASPPVVYLAGGPGGSGIVTLLGARQPVFAAMREFGDVIALEQRGTMPWNMPWLMCPNTSDYPLDRPYDPAADLAILGPYVGACEEHYRAQGVDIQNYNTLESAADLEDLRIHLGAEQLTLWATSYGTHLAFAYIKAHPDRVYRTIMHGVEGPDHTIKLPGDADAMLDEIARRAAADPDLRTPDLVSDLRTILARLEAEPVRVEVTNDDAPTTVVLGPRDIQLYTARRLGGPWMSMALPAIVAEMKRGDFSRYAHDAIRDRRGLRLSLMALQMDCASGVSDERRARYQRELATSVLGGALNDPFPGICEHVHAPDLGAEFRTLRASEVPVLFISGSLDGRTPPSNTEDVRALFANGQSIYIDGAGHGDDLFLASPQILAGMQQFMRGQPVAATNLRIERRFEPVLHAR